MSAKRIFVCLNFVFPHCQRVSGIGPGACFCKSAF